VEQLEKIMLNRKVTVIFDLDETVINSSHRTPNNDDGTLNLQAYIALHTPENVAKDVLLPLARTMQRLIAEGHKVAIITARDMAACDYEYLAANGIKPKHIYSRDKAGKKHYRMRDGEYKVEWIRRLPKTLLANHIIMFDDAKPVKSALRKLGIVCICGIKVNKKLDKLSSYILH
jgi:FMN phosphatase YigB (HAD superfamily)